MLIKIKAKIASLTSQFCAMSATKKAAIAVASLTVLLAVAGALLLTAHNWLPIVVALALLVNYTNNSMINRRNQELFKKAETAEKDAALIVDFVDWVFSDTVRVKYGLDVRLCTSFLPAMLRNLRIEWRGAVPVYIIELPIFPITAELLHLLSMDFTVPLNDAVPEFLQRKYIVPAQYGITNYLQILATDLRQGSVKTTITIEMLLISNFENFKYFQNLQHPRHCDFSHTIESEVGQFEKF